MPQVCPTKFFQQARLSTSYPYLLNDYSINCHHNHHPPPKKKWVPFHDPAVFHRGSPSPIRCWHDNHDISSAQDLFTWAMKEKTSYLSIILMVLVGILKMVYYTIPIQLGRTINPHTNPPKQPQPFGPFFQDPLIWRRRSFGPISPSPLVSYFWINVLGLSPGVQDDRLATGL